MYIKKVTKDQVYENTLSTDYLWSCFAQIKKILHYPKKCAKFSPRDERHSNLKIFTMGASLK